MGNQHHQQQQDGADILLVPKPQMHIMTRRGMPPKMQHLLHALSGSDSRGPLVYTGDVSSSLERLRSDLHTHHSELCNVLGEPHRPDYPSFPGLQPLMDSSPGMPSTLLDYNITPGGPHGLGQLGSMISNQSLASSSQMQAIQGRGLQGSGFSYQPSMLGWHAGGSLHARQQLYAGAYNPRHHYQPPAPSHAQFPGSRLSEFAVRAPLHQDPGSLFVAESSTFMWPPVGATFDGHRSHAISNQSNQIDSLADLGYQKKKTPTFEELASEALSGTAVRRQHMSSKDTLDAFLSDYVKGASKPPVTYDPYGSAHDLNVALSRFAAGRGMASAR